MKPLLFTICIKCGFTYQAKLRDGRICPDCKAKELEKEILEKLHSEREEE
jgi:predicted Zn-ribbon and HTH transcriptional regulator